MTLLAARITHLLTGALVGAAILAPAASAQSPPPAAPDLGAMAIGAQDLPRGAKVIDEGPTKYPGADAAYERSFNLGRRAARAAGFEWLDSTVALYEDAPTTSSLFRALRRSLASARGRRELARSIARSLEIPVRRVSVGSVRTLSAGDASFELPVTIRVAGVKLCEVLAYARVDRVLAELMTGGSGSVASLMRRTGAMLDTSARHIRAGLPAAAASRRKLQTHI